jgi:hypothetical protein
MAGGVALDWLAFGTQWVKMDCRVKQSAARAYPNTLVLAIVCADSGRNE